MVNHVMGAEVACQHNYDCCECGQILCTDGCAGLVCNGDASCFGVKNIIIEGQEVGAPIICNGDLSCQGTYINGTNIEELYCTGEGSCAYSKVNAQCTVSVDGIGCELQCVGRQSCEGDPLDPRKVAIYHVENSYGLTCGVEGCRYGSFLLPSDTGGSVECSGANGCESAEIIIHGAESLNCDGIESCRHAHIVLLNPMNEHFTITCSGDHACHGVDIEVIVSDPTVISMEGIFCNSANACESMHIAVVKTGAAAVTQGLNILHLDCSMKSACLNMQIDLGQHVAITECTCATGACQGLIGTENCPIPSVM